MEKARMERIDSIDKLGVAKCPYCHEEVNIIKKEVLVVEADKSPSDKPVWCESFRETQYVLSMEKQAAKNKIAELEKELAELRRKVKCQPQVCHNKTVYQEIGGYMVYNHILVEKLPDEFMTNGTLEKEQLKKQFTDHFAMTGQMVACKLLREW